jgi:hypothetical protein
MMALEKKAGQETVKLLVAKGADASDTDQVPEHDSNFNYESVPFDMYQYLLLLITCLSLQV